jgi:CheY-like chemotaxis protein
MARILIGNDEPSLLQLLAEILEGAGHTVQIVADGSEAVQLVKQWRPDVVVLDLVMPKIDGAGAIKALRADPATADIPVLMISGSAHAAAVASQVGAMAFLAKPFTPAELVARVEEVLPKQ